ncbi:MAG: hypothetical protein ACD_79C00945G0005 [uncultured bacterium]|nr:MAG: hypothetical protein ACD_79C00945G0005 [uncultured bacterium]
MKTIKIKQATPGMITSKPVITKSGMVLLSEGNTITEKHIDIFKKWGIQEITVDAPENTAFNDSESRKINAKQLKDIESKLASRFIFDEDNSVIKEIKRVVIKISAAESA